MMNDEVLERYIAGHMEASSGDSVMFSWHGGEPTLAGTGFFRKVIELQQRLRTRGERIINGIQTNGTLLDAALCQFFSENGFVIGISMDGQQFLHDRHRAGKGGESSFRQTLNGYKLLQEFGIPTEVLCVVHAQNVDHPLEIYRFFRDLGVRYLTFLPLVDRIHSSRSNVSEYSVRAAQTAVYELLKIRRPVPPITRHDKSISVLIDTLEKAFA